MSAAPPLACTACGRFVPADFAAFNSDGDYGELVVDETLCEPCGGPAPPSRAWMVRSGRDPETGLSPEEEALIEEWKHLDEVTDCPRTATTEEAPHG